MKRLFIICGILALVLITALVLENKLDNIFSRMKTRVINKEQQAQHQKIASLEAATERLRAKADTALLYAKDKGFDLNHAFLVDFSIHSGKKRFFVWDYQTNTVNLSSLCAHGTGKDNHKSTFTDIKYSNVEGSLCSSLGKYKTGIRSYSNYGINVHYKLHGLENTNDNAFERIVVLHSFAPIPKEEIYPRHLPLGYSQGCPVVDDDAMREIDKIMKNKEKSVLLWIYN